MQLTVAATLEDVYKTLSPKPLTTPEQLDAYYQDSLNRVRGGTKTAQMARELRRARDGGSFYKAVLMGHQGVGKTTELTRLIEHPDVAGRFQALWFSALSDLDPGSFKPFDVVLVMMIRLVEETAKPVEEGGAGKRPSDSLLEAVRGWFATETAVHTQGTSVGASVEAGAGLKGDSLWAAITGLFFNAKGDVKYASDRKKEVVEYRLSRIFPLIQLANDLLDACNSLLLEATGKEWLFVGDDFEKSGISLGQTEDLFINYANIFADLRAHLIFTVPIALVYSDRAAQLPFGQRFLHTIPDTPVFTRDHSLHIEGRHALRSVLFARVSPELFEDEQLERLLVASGGNLRDLFALVTQAADEALDRPSPSGKIGEPDATRAINAVRNEYERRLGISPDDEKQGIDYEKKAARLVQVYLGDATAKIADPVLHSLLRSRAVQEFNGERWFGVHPLVVDILHAQNKIADGVDGSVSGGTLGT